MEYTPFIPPEDESLTDKDVKKDAKKKRLVSVPLSELFNRKTSETSETQKGVKRQKFADLLLKKAEVAADAPAPMDDKVSVADNVLEKETSEDVTPEVPLNAQGSSSELDVSVERIELNDLILPAEQPLNEAEPIIPRLEKSKNNDEVIHTNDPEGVLYVRGKHEDLAVDVVDEESPFFEESEAKSPAEDDDLIRVEDIEELINTEDEEEPVSVLPFSPPAVSPIPPVEATLNDGEADEPLPPPVTTVLPLVSSPDSQYISPNQQVTPPVIHEATTEKSTVRNLFLPGALFGWVVGRRGKSKELLSQKKKIHALEKRAKDSEENEAYAIRISKEQAEEQARQNEFTNRRIEDLSDYQVHIADQLPVPKIESSPIVVAESRRAVTSNGNFSKSVEMVKKTETKQEDELSMAEAPETAPSITRVETSAWHSYEVDARTGALAESSTIEYGKAFEQERRAERFKEPPMSYDATTGVLSKLPETALQQAGVAVNDVVLPAIVQNAAALQPVTDIKRNSNVTARDAVKKVSSHLGAGVTWLGALLVVVLLYLVGAIR
jgi:hypothetical protein